MITFRKRQKGICPLKLKIGACNDKSSFSAYSVKQILPILFLLHNQLSQACLELFLLCSILQLLLVCLSRFDMKNDDVARKICQLWQVFHRKSKRRSISTFPPVEKSTLWSLISNQSRMSNTALPQNSNHFVLF